MYDVKDDPSFKTPVRNLQFPPTMMLRMRGSLHTFNHARELKLSTQVRNHIWCSLSKMVPSFKTPVRNLQHPLSMTLRMWGS